MQEPTNKEARNLAFSLFRMETAEAVNEARNILASYRNGAGRLEVIINIAEARQRLGIESCRSRSSKPARELTR